MYPVQVMISYFTTSFTVIMHIGREVTAKQYTGGGLQDSKGTYIKKTGPGMGASCFIWI